MTKDLPVKTTIVQDGIWTHYHVERDMTAPAASVWTDPQAAQFLQDIFAHDDPRPAAEQVQDRYAHGGGWCPAPGFSLSRVDTIGGAILSYPGDPAFPELSRCVLSPAETVILFDYGLVAVVQTADGSFAVTRMD